MKAITKDEIPNLKYEGWFWLSDMPAPTVLNGKEFSGNELHHNGSFVVEAQLWDKDTETSISIRYADGRHYITLYNLREMPRDLKSEARTLLGHRLGGHDLCVIDLWQETDLKIGSDETMKTLVPMCSVFAGFERNEKQ